MSRAPLPDWRRLWAAGGAPAASHAALSRPPAPDRLLAPLDRLPLAHVTSLDALTAPLDPFAVLVSALGAPAVAEAPPPPTEEAPARTRGSPTFGREAPRSPGRRRDRGEPPAERVLASELTEPAVHDDAPRRPPTPGPARGARGRRSGAAPPHRASRPRGGAPGPAGPLGAVTVNRWPEHLTLEAGAGAADRVLLDQPVEAIERLLSQGAPETGRPARAAVKRSVGSVADPVAVQPAAARRLAEGHRGHGRQRSASALEGGPAERGNAVGVPLTDLQRRVHVAAPTVAEPPTDGGFRGLALRVAGSPAAEAHIPVRLERERRFSADVALDALDVQVAESLARVLAREARRHGIDPTEART